MDIKNFITRALSGFVYVLIIVLGIMTSKYAFVGLCALLTFLATREFLVMTKPEGSKFVLWLDVIVLTLAVTLIAMCMVCGFDICGMVLIGLSCIYLLSRPIIQLYNSKENPIKSIAYSLMALVYIVLPMFAMIVIYEYSQQLLLLLFIMIWLNDTGAYLVGCTMGKHRLFERISPKKSWEGFWGGMLFSAIAGVVYYSLGFETQNELDSAYACALLGIVVSIFATFGDLVESMFKRSLGVKDSGNLIPGHGGILDRIDSLLFVLPASVVLIFLLSVIF